MNNLISPLAERPVSSSDINPTLPSDNFNGAFHESPSPTLFDIHTSPPSSHKSKFDNSDMIIISMLLWTFFVIFLRILILRKTFFNWLLNINFFSANLLPKLSMIICLVSICIFLIMTVMRRQNFVYLVDHVSWQPPDSSEISHQLFIEKAMQCNSFTPISLKLQASFLARNGLGQKTYLPPNVSFAVIIIF
jgi:hypothetical protein